MRHLILFHTKQGSFLVNVCVGKYVDIEEQLRERIEIEGVTFNGKDDVAAFMDEYVERYKNEKADYLPNWLFENIIEINNDLAQ